MYYYLYLKRKNKNLLKRKVFDIENEKDKVIINKADNIISERCSVSSESSKVTNDTCSTEEIDKNKGFKKIKLN